MKGYNKIIDEIQEDAISAKKAKARKKSKKEPEEEKPVPKKSLKRGKSKGKE